MTGGAGRKASRNEEIVALYKTRLYSLRQVAEQFGLTHERVRQILIARDVTLNPWGCHHLKKMAEEA